MKKMKTRFGMYETNSSSTHSLCFGNNILVGEIDDELEGVSISNNILMGGIDDELEEEASSINITLGVGEYGWGYEEVHTPLGKMDYLAIETRLDEDKKDLLLVAIKSKYPDINVTFSYTGYIDHQSAGRIWRELHNVEKVINFIFSDSYIIIDNDENDCAFFY